MGVAFATEISIPFAALLLIIFGAIVGFIVWMLQQHLSSKAETAREEKRAAKAERDTTEDQWRARIVALEAKDSQDSQSLALLKQSILPIEEALKQKLVATLLHPSDDFVLPDEIVRKIQTGKPPLTADEESSLALVLHDRARSTNPHVSEYEKAAAEALLAVDKLATAASRVAAVSPITEIQLVSSTIKSTAQKAKDEEISAT